MGFDLSIQYEPGSSTRILDQPLLRVLGLDRFNTDGTPSVDGDGQFDFRPGFTIDQTHGEIILPSLRPFDGGIRAYFASRGIHFPDSVYCAPEIYDTTKTFAQIGFGGNYTLSGHALSY